MDKSSKNIKKSSESNKQIIEVDAIVCADTSRLKVMRKKDSAKTPYYLIPVNVYDKNGNLILDETGQPIVSPAILNKFIYEKDENGFNIKDVDTDNLEENKIPKEGDTIRVSVDRVPATDRQGNPVYDEDGNQDTKYFFYMKCKKYPSPEDVFKYLEEMLDKE